MYRRAFLTVLLVCCLGVSLVAVQPGLASAATGTSPLLDDESDESSHETSGGEMGDEDDRWGESEESDDEETNDEESVGAEEGDGETNDSDEEDERGWGKGNDSDDDRRWGENRSNDSDENDSEYRTEMDDSETRNGSDGETNDSDAVGRENGSDEETDAEGDERETSDGEDRSADANRSSNLTEAVVNVTGLVTGVTEVSEVTTDATDGATDETAGTSDGPTVVRFGRGEEPADDEEVSAVLDRSFAEEDDLDRLRVAGKVVSDLPAIGAIDDAAVSLLAPADRDEDGPSKLSSGGEDERAATDEPRLADGGDDALPGSTPIERDADASGGDDGADEDRDGAGVPGGDDGELPSDAPGEGAALLLLVGYLGGTRFAVNQSVMLATVGQNGFLGTVQQLLGVHPGELADRVVPPVFGYSRHDDSDPLENETRAHIFDIVRDSPGMYYAQLAEETDVTVETVRYHSRILEEEGLVERRKLRGRQRLYPVSMDNDEPELGAAMADSAASDVLSVIERREPTTLSSVADAIDCAPSTVAYHLDRLEDDGLVTRERDGGSVRIRLRTSTRSALQGSVADD